MGAFKSFFTWLLKPVHEFWYRVALDSIEGSQSVEALDKFWNSLDIDYQTNTIIKAAYNTRKTDLTTAGQTKIKNRILGYFGEQIANAVWAVTEHTLPQVVAWIDEVQETYHLRTEELEDLKKLAASGEFGLNAVVQFLLYMTVRTPVRIASDPYWEDLEHATWAAHPSKLPTMADLVRMEYREVFRPEFRKELIEDEPISSDFKALTAQLGYSQVQAENYWGAHWDLPSRSQAYEMYHRLRPAISVGGFNLPATTSTPFELNDLNSLLKRSDVLYRYRSQLVAIAYKPLTRVDVRRMYRAGVLSFEEVISAYLDAGYNPEKALKMAEFTKAWVTEGVEKRETKGGVLDAMKTGIISEAEAETELGAFYPADVAERYVEIAKVKNKLNMTQVGKLLGMEEMDESEARDRFAEMGYPSDDVDYLITLYAPEESSM